MARNTRTYKDLDFNFSRHPRTNDVSVKYDEEAVKQSIRNLVLTKNYERPFRSNLGCQVTSLLFEPVSPLLTTMIEKSIRDVITNYEPRVVLLDVIVSFKEEYNEMLAYIVFRIRNTLEPISFNLILERTR